MRCKTCNGIGLTRVFYYVVRLSNRTEKMNDYAPIVFKPMDEGGIPPEESRFGKLKVDVCRCDCPANLKHCAEIPAKYHFEPAREGDLFATA